MSSSPPSERARLLTPVLGVLLLGCVLLLPRLGASGFWDPWEPRYVQASREMTQRGEFVVPYYRDNPRVNKAPLTYWLIAGSRAAFGPSETASRLPSAVLGILGAIALALGFALRGLRLAGFLAGAALLTGPQWPLVGRFATPDTPLAAALAVTLAVALAWPALSDPRARRIALAIGLGSIVAAGLADWPRGLLLPIWAVLAWAAIERRLWAGIGLGLVAGLYHAGQLLHHAPLNLVAHAGAVVLAAIALVRVAGWSVRRVAAAGALVVVLVAPWFFALAFSMPEGEEVSLYRYKYAFNLGEDEGDHTGPYLDVARLVALGGLPWSAAALLGFGLAFASKREPLARPLAGVTTAGLLFFTLSEAQMGHFYGVIQPALAGLAAIGLVALARQPGWRALGLVVPTAVVAWWAFDKPSMILETATVKSSLYGIEVARPAVAAIGIWLVVVFVAAWRRRPEWLVAAVLPAAALAGYLAIDVVPALERRKSVAPMWRRYLEARVGDEPLGLYGTAKDGAFYYSNNGVERLEGPGQLRRFFERDGPSFLMLPDPQRKEVAEIAPDQACETLDSSHATHALIRCSPKRKPG